VKDGVCALKEKNKGNGRNVHSKGHRKYSFHLNKEGCEGQPIHIWDGIRETLEVF
jgi:hypothetical protein